MHYLIIFFYKMLNFFLFSNVLPKYVKIDMFQGYLQNLLYHDCYTTTYDSLSLFMARNNVQRWMMFFFIKQALDMQPSTLALFFIFPFTFWSSYKVTSIFYKIFHLIYIKGIWHQIHRFASQMVYQAFISHTYSFFFPSTKFTPSSKILHGMKNKIIKSMSYINKLIKHNIIILILTHFRCQMQVKLISNNSMTKE